MRVIINQFPALGRKTGIGHYISELLGCLSAQVGEDAISAYPNEWLGLGVRLGRRIVGEYEGQRSLRSRISRWIRQRGYSALCRHLRSTIIAGKFDLYHEPNYIPLPTDLPTVTTICD